MEEKYRLSYAYTENLQMLKDSCDLFDSGKTHEAKRISSILTILLHTSNNKRNISLFDRLNFTKIIMYRSTNTFFERSLIGGVGLATVHIVQNKKESFMRYEPRLGKFSSHFSRFIDFDKWWNEKIVKVEENSTLTRKELVLCVRDGDGGAHVDGLENLSKNAKTYYDLVYGKGVFHRRSGDYSEKIDPGPHLVSIRQIAYELQSSIEFWLTRSTAFHQPFPRW